MANFITDKSAFYETLKPGITAITQYYDLYPEEWKEIYTIIDSKKSEETYLEGETLVGVGRFTDGATMPMATAGIGNKFTAPNFKYGLGFTITEDLLEDCLYPEMLPTNLEGVKNALRTFKEQEGIAIFDNAFDPISPEYLMGDGEPLCSTQHRLKTGTASNKLQAAQLSMTSYQAAINAVQNFKDLSGQPIKVLPTRLLIGTDNEFTAAIITGTSQMPGGANNDINPLVHGDYIRGNFIVSHFMNNKKNYFLLTDINRGFIHQRKQSLTVRPNIDGATGNLNMYCHERYRFVAINFRACIGVQDFS